jgi:hypothetical protein
MTAASLLHVAFAGDASAPGETSMVMRDPAFRRRAKRTEDSAAGDSITTRRRWAQWFLLEKRTTKFDPVLSQNSDLTARTKPLILRRRGQHAILEHSPQIRMFVARPRGSKRDPNMRRTPGHDSSGVVYTLLTFSTRGTTR